MTLTALSPVDAPGSPQVLYPAPPIRVHPFDQQVAS